MNITSDDGAILQTEVLQRKMLFWKRTSIACAAAGLALGVFGFQNSAGKKIVGVSGGDSYIYRVYDDGSIDFIQADNQIKTAKGIPDWQAIPIDASLKRQSR